MLVLQFELWRYWSEAHHIYNRYSLIMAVINAHIQIVILELVFKC